ncbi:MAG TPA: transglycosylase SLT domain-containing protein, partial [Candidatus Binatia bacterium]|nr:transglycosylase SLT domain-containing protein [Candidatus Binatia bacterium]
APASADVYYYKDADGAFHFTNVPRPDAVPFLVDHPIARLSPVEVDLQIPDTNDYDDIISKFANRFHVERALVKAVIRAESGFNRLAVSSAGARGLMQLMPQTARRHGVRNVYDPAQNIEGGVRHLRLLIDRHGYNLPRVLAAYNAGSEPVERYHGIPPYTETQDYVARVLRFRQQYLRQERLAAASRNS